MRPRAIVFDLFGSLLRYRGGEAPLRQLITLLGHFGVSPASTRVVMARLRKEGWFTTRPGDDGREVVYALTEQAWTMLDEGQDRIFTPPPTDWDGWWHMVIYYVPEIARDRREDLRKTLTWLGFGMLSPSTWVAPHDRLDAVEARFADDPAVRLDLLRARSKGLPADRAMAERCWDLAAIDADYHRFLSDYRPLAARFRSGRMSPTEALVARIELIQRWRQFPFRDPGLPAALAPAGWHGQDAFALFSESAELLSTQAEAALDAAATGGFPVRSSTI